MSKSKPQPPPDQPDYQALFKLLPLPYFVVRAVAPDYPIVAVSEAHAAMKGATVSSMLGKPFTEIFPALKGAPEDLRTVITTKDILRGKPFRRDIPDEHGVLVEKYWRRTYSPLLNEKREVAFVLSTSVDVTNELRTTRQLSELEEQLDDALEIGRIGSWLWDVEPDIIKLDKTLAQMYGLSPKKAAKGFPAEVILNIIHAEDRKRVVEEIESALKTGAEYESQYRTISPGGTVRWVLARGRRRADKNGKMSTFPGVIVDITERHEFETELENARMREVLNRKEAELLHKRNKELEVLNQSKDEFVALASHQLRTPATAVKQYIGMVLQGYVGDVSDLQMEMLGKAFESNERQIQIIDQILSAARVDTGKLVMVPAPLNIRALVRGTVEEMRPGLEEKGHAVLARLGGAPIEVCADVNYLRMALENILNNAGSYTNAPGRINVSVRKVGKNVRVAISDNGVGIKKSDINKLFAKFSRIPNPLSVQAGGSGIGLYLTAEILRLHQGTILVESRVRKGTTFTMVLPIWKSNGK